MRAGSLKQSITIQSKTSEAGDRGQNIGLWCDKYAQVPASIMTLSGRELELAHEVFATATHTIRCRYLPCIDETMQILWNDGTKTRTFGIGAVMIGNEENDQRQLGLTLLCSERKTG